MLKMVFANIARSVQNHQKIRDNFDLIILDYDLEQKKIHLITPKMVCMLQKKC